MFQKFKVGSLHFKGFKLVQNVTHIGVSWSLQQHDIEFNKTKK